MTHRIFVMVLSLSLIVPFLNAQQTENEPIQERQQSLKLDRALVRTYVALRNFVNPIIVNRILNKIGNTNPKVAIASQCAFDIASHVAAYKYLGSSKKTSELLKGGAAFAVEGLASKTVDAVVDKISDKYFPETKPYGLLDIIKGRAFLFALGLNYQNTTDRITEILNHDRKLNKIAHEVNNAVHAVDDFSDADSQMVLLNLRLFTVDNAKKKSNNLIKSLQIHFQSQRGKSLDFLVAGKAVAKIGLSYLATNFLQKWA